MPKTNHVQAARRRVDRLEEQLTAAREVLVNAIMDDHHNGRSFRAIAPDAGVSPARIGQIVSKANGQAE